MSPYAGRQVKSLHILYERWSILLARYGSSLLPGALTHSLSFSPPGLCMSSRDLAVPTVRMHVFKPIVPCYQVSFHFDVSSCARGPRLLVGPQTLQYIVMPPISGRVMSRFRISPPTSSSHVTSLAPKHTSGTPKPPPASASSKHHCQPP